MWAVQNTGTVPVQLQQLTINATACDTGIVVYFASPAATVNSVGAPTPDTKAAWSAFKATGQVGSSGLASIAVPPGLPPIPAGWASQMYAFASCGPAIVRFSPAPPYMEVRLQPLRSATSDGTLSVFTGLPVTNTVGGDAFSGTTAPNTNNTNGRLPSVDIAYTTACAPPPLLTPPPPPVTVPSGSLPPPPPPLTIVPKPLPPPVNTTTAPAPPSTVPTPQTTAPAASSPPPESPTSSCCSAAYFSDHPAATAGVAVAVVGVVGLVIYMVVRARRQRGDEEEGEDGGQQAFLGMRTKLKM